MVLRRARAAGRLIAVVAAIVALTAVAGCGGGAPAAPSSGDPSWDAVVQRANEQGVVNLYHVVPPEQMDRVVEAFHERYPDIEVNPTRGVAELVARVSAEVQNNTDGGDVFLFSDPAWFTDNAAALLPADGPASRAWPAEGWRVPGSAPTVSVVPFGMLVWNTRTFPQGFTSFEDLLRPDVAGRLGTRSDITPTVAGYLDFLQGTYGPQYMQQLWAQQPKFYPSSVPLTQAVAAGEIAVANISTPAVIADLKGKGAPIDSLVPNPGYSTEFVAAALRKTPRPDAARVFVDFVMSPEGQAAMNGNGYGGSKIAVDGAIDVGGQTILDPDKYTPEVIEGWRSRFAQGFR